MNYMINLTWYHKIGVAKIHLKNFEPNHTEILANKIFMFSSGSNRAIFIAVRYYS
jgi:hypothetical protein